MKKRQESKDRRGPMNERGIRILRYTQTVFRARRTSDVGRVAGDTVVTVGRESLSAWHLRTGKPAWPELAIELPDGTKTSGRGVAAGQHYFLPVTEAEVLGVRTATGRIEQRLPLADRQARGLGNLVAVGPLLLSQSAESIQAFATMPEPAEEPAD